MKKLLIFSILLLLIITAGCVFKVGPEAETTDEPGKIAPLEDAEQTVVIEEAEEEAEADDDATVVETVDCGPFWLQYKVHLADGFSETAAAALTNDCVKTYVPNGSEISSDISGIETPTGPSFDAITEITNYLSANPVAAFPDLSTRLLTASKSSDFAKITYRTSVMDPGTESVYLCGVLLLKYPGIDEVNVTGLNDDDKEMEASIKHFERKKYNFNNYKIWFPDFEYDECAEDIDCDDDNECTKDFCREQKCYNSKLVIDNCP